MLSSSSLRITSHYFATHLKYTSWAARPRPQSRGRTSGFWCLRGCAAPSPLRWPFATPPPRPSRYHAPFIIILPHVLMCFDLDPIYDNDDARYDYGRVKACSCNICTHWSLLPRRCCVSAGAPCRSSNLFALEPVFRTTIRSTPVIANLNFYMFELCFNSARANYHHYLLSFIKFLATTLIILILILTAK